jgi:hypothetical protein
MRRIVLVLAVAAVMQALFAISAFAQEEPPDLAPGCDQFRGTAASQLHSNPAYDAFVRGYDELGGIGPCFAPHPGGRD